MIPTDIATIFAIVRAGLLAQDGPSFFEDKCWYRHGARRCAIGWLIPNHLYDPNIEEKNAHCALKMIGLWPEELDGTARNRLIYVLAKLQDAHDDTARYSKTTTPEEWRQAISAALDTVARDIGVAG